MPRPTVRLAVAAHMTVVTLLLADAAGHYASGRAYGDVAATVSKVAGALMGLTTVALAASRPRRSPGSAR